MTNENTQDSFCLFCMGSGKQRDSILLRDQPCTHCNGTGCALELKDQSKAS